MATKVQENEEAQEAPVVETADGPLLDLSDAAVKKMIKTAKKRGYVTIDELNGVLPDGEVSSDQIEDIYAMLNDMGINVIETDEVEEADEAEDEPEGGELTEAATTAVAAKPAREPTDRTDDPVRMYLREMGSVELLSREGEIAIAKRIEAGRETMIAGLCEIPLTFQAIIIWRDELNAGKILLRDIIDLEATYAGPDAKAAPAVPEGEGAVPGAVPGNGAAPAPGGRPTASAARPAPPPLPATRMSTRSRPSAPGSPPRRTTRTSSRTRCRSPRWRPSSSRRWSRPSTPSPTSTRSSAACRTRTSSSR